jgi:hypothetical protein
MVKLAGATGLEPATSCVTGRRSNQLNYAQRKLTKNDFALLIPYADDFVILSVCPYVRCTG